ncbi:hypothetical protein J4462_04735 [Candidatus Pacearchaeota archaeon]|nr:hypothetical protein [Candidatus Pacearchaeota archaeon]
MLKENERLSRQEIAEYIKVTGYVRYWEGSLNTAILFRDEQNRVIVAQILLGVMKEYKEKVPEDLRSLVNINLCKLETLVSEILES